MSDAVHQNETPLAGIYHNHIALKKIDPLNVFSDTARNGAYAPPIDIDNRS
jgi:hypothetical protein